MAYWPVVVYLSVLQSKQSMFLFRQQPLNHAVCCTFNVSGFLHSLQISIFRVPYSTVLSHLWKLYGHSVHKLILTHKCHKLTPDKKNTYIKPHEILQGKTQLRRVKTRTMERSSTTQYMDCVSKHHLIAYFFNFYSTDACIFCQFLVQKKSYVQL